MLHAHTLSTSEIDSPEDAVADITRQLAQTSLCAHTVGIMVCHYDYAYGGVVAAVCDTLPFQVIGCTSFSHATSRADGLYEMSITVLTSDDVHFAVAQGVCDAANPGESIRAIYRAGHAIHGVDPSLIISILPEHLPVSGDAYLREVDAASGGIAHFGTIATGDAEQGDEIYTIANGKAHTDVINMLLCLGDVHARFTFGSFPEDNLFERSATVTSSDGTWVREVNHVTAVDFLLQNSVDMSEEARGGLIIIPFMHRRTQEEPLIARTLTDAADDGSVHFVGEIPTGSVFRGGTVSIDGILDVSRQVTRRALAAEPKPALAMIFSCIGRYIALGLDVTSEIKCVTAEIAPDIPFLMSYAGGELCPVPSGQATVNRFHNNSIIICTLA